VSKPSTPVSTPKPSTSTSAPKPSTLTPTAVYTPNPAPSKLVTYTPPKPQTQYQQVAAANQQAAKSTPNALTVAGRFLKGAFEAGKDAVIGAATMAYKFAAPESAIKNGLEIAAAGFELGKKIGENPQAALKGAKDAVVNEWNKFKDGDANVKAEYVGRVVFDAGLSIVGTKGIDKLAKAGKAADAAADLSKLQKLAGKATKAVDEGAVKGTSGSYAPERPLPRTKHGDPMPDSDAPHTQLGQRDDGYGSYNQARTWEVNPNGNGVTTTKDIDFSNHNSPDIHPNPHQHTLTPNNHKTAPKGGYQRGGPEPLK